LALRSDAHGKGVAGLQGGVAGRRLLLPHNYVPIPHTLKETSRGAAYPRVWACDI
jgi:hypothetical protein